jgi:hypothetical protein
MPLKHVYKKKIGKVTFRSGHFYRFKYRAWHNDPKPVVIFMSAISGINDTGHQWRLIQCINFTYIPRAIRKRFLKIWMKELDKPGRIQFTWKKIVAKYPYLKPAIRRYSYLPAYFISNVKEIPLDEAEKAVIGTLAKDFSKKAAMALRKKKRAAVKKIKSFFKKKKKPTPTPTKRKK